MTDTINEQQNQPIQDEVKKEKNIGMAILAYLGILIIIPLLTDARKEAYVKFHIKQGLVLLIAFVINSIVWAIPILGWIAGFIIGIILFILLIMGIINAASGKETSLPILGKYADKFKI
ncbi:MAG: hypothetical protein PHN37_02330 [Candidatus Pacebacteria bacterium]|nr:hypothetical protein [Candidatus Paceibacterota bacterium]